MTDDWQDSLEYLDFLQYRLRLKTKYARQHRALTAEQRVEMEERMREHLEVYTECNGLPRAWEESWIFA